jgi:hypothetical protein
VVGFRLDSDYESIAKLWLCSKKFGVINIVSSTACWCIWKLRNCLCFRGVPWSGMKTLWQRVIPLLRCWKILVLLKMNCASEDACSELEKLAMLPEAILPPPARGAMPDDAAEDAPDSTRFQFQPP